MDLTDNNHSARFAQETNQYHFYIGLCLAVSSSLFIGSSFIIKKLSLRRLNKVGLRASAGGYGYLKDWMWWIGLLTMGVGELANFVAYAFAPASLVTPLGALSVLVATILATKFLNETLNANGKMGCILCILGSTVFVIHAPREKEFESLEAIMEVILQPQFLYYFFIVCALAILIIFFLGPKYGNKYVMVYIALCSAVGSLTVMSCKALGLSIRISHSGALSTKDIWIVFLLFLAVVFFICLQMNYLNKALDIFDTSIVTPVYYVTFTTMVIVVSGIVFKEWANMAATEILGALCGFFITIVAIFLLSRSRNKSSQQTLQRSSWMHESNNLLRS